MWRIATMNLDADSVPEQAQSQPGWTGAPDLPLGFVNEQSTVSEADGYIRIPLGVPADLLLPVQLRVIIQEGTAFAGDDFAVPISDSLLISSTAEPVELFLPLVSDARPEFIEDFVVKLESMTPGVQVARNEIVVVILDDDELTP